MEVISYAKYLASPQYRKFPFKGLVGWIVGNFPPSVEDLQRKYNFTYYSTIGKAVTDVNNGTLANADANKNTAVAGVYTDKDGGKNVVLLKDTTEAARVSPKVDMIINLGGHVLLFDDNLGINIASGNVTIDGRLDDSAIQIVRNDEKTARAVQVASGNAIVNGGAYITHSQNGSSSSMWSQGNLTVSNAYIKATGSGGQCQGIQSARGNLKLTNCTIQCQNANGAAGVINSADAATITNCDIKVIATDGKTSGIHNNGTGTITNCDIRAYSNYYADGEGGYSASSRGVANWSTLTINDCYVFGTHSGMENHGTLYVNGGTYEGYGHGGIYFAGTGTTAYVRNATLKDALTMPEGYIATSNHNGAGFYIGGAEGNDNIKVYMDNCKIYGSNIDQVIVLRGSSGELNNSLYMSNSTIEKDAKIRIDNDTHELYIGKGCNFTAENTTLPSAVIATDEVYVQGVA